MIYRRKKKDDVENTTKDNAENKGDDMSFEFKSKGVSTSTFTHASTNIPTQVYEELNAEALSAEASGSAEYGALNMESVEPMYINVPASIKTAK